MLNFKQSFSKIFSIRAITLAAVMLSMTVVIVKFFNISVRVGAGSKGQMIIGFGWLPNIIFSFLYGPIWGLIFGFSSDFILFILKPGFYDIFHAIQKPIVGFLAGCAGILYLIIKNLKLSKKQQWIIFIIVEILLYSLMILIYLLLFFFEFKYFINYTKKLIGQKWSLIYQIIFATIIGLLFIILQIIICYNFLKSKNLKNQDLNLLFIIIFLQLTITIINSWILSPISNWFWYHIPYIFSLLPRLIKETVLMPIKIFLYYAILKILIKLYLERYYFNLKLNLNLKPKKYEK